MKGYLRKKGLSEFHSQRNTSTRTSSPPPPPPTTLRFQDGSSYTLPGAQDVT